MTISEMKTEHQSLKNLNVKLEEDLNMVITKLEKSGKIKQMIATKMLEKLKLLSN